MQQRVLDAGFAQDLRRPVNRVAFADRAQIEHHAFAVESDGDGFSLVK